MRVLHPFMPFITEEIYQEIKGDSDWESITIAEMPGYEKYDNTIIEQFDFAKLVIVALRNLRQEKNIPQKQTLDLFIKKNHEQSPDITFDGIVKKLCNIEHLDYVHEKPSGAHSVIVKSTELLIPLDTHVNIEEELERLRTELKYQEGFLAGIEKKLSNERFVNNAPEKVVALEQKKKQDAEAKISVIREQLKNLEK